MSEHLSKWAKHENGRPGSEHVLRTICSAVLLLLSTPLAGLTQFVTPTPAPQSDLLARTGGMRRAIAPFLEGIDTECLKSVEIAQDPERRREPLADAALRFCRTNQKYVNRLSTQMQYYCRRFPMESAQWTQCMADAQNKELALEVLMAGDASPHPIFVPFIHGRDGLVRAYRDYGKFDLLRKFSANVREDQIFVLTDVVSGAIGVFPFGVTTATIVTKDDSDTTSNMVVVEGLTSDLTRLVNNGGTLSGRLVLPMLSGIGPNARMGASIATQFGLIGDLGEPDSLAASGATVGEFLFSFALRETTVEARRVGDVHLGVRFGWAWKESPLAPDIIDKREFFFLQAGFAVAKVDPGADDGGKLSLGILLTLPLATESIEDRVPRLMVNLAAQP